MSHALKPHFCIILLVALASAPLRAQTASSQAPATAAVDSLKDMRQQIDTLDHQLIDLLARRMRVCLDVAEYKKRHGMPVVQKGRYHEILEKRSAQGMSKGLDGTFVKNMMNLIHDESVRLQEELLRSEAPDNKINKSHEEKK